MAPIYDSDIAQERFKKDQWRNFELFEKVEKRLQNKKRILIVLTIILFLILSSISVVSDLTPRWKSREAVRKLGETLSHLKRDAAILGEPLSFTFKGESLDFEIAQIDSCQSHRTVRVIESGSLMTPPKSAEGLRLIASREAQDLGLVPLSESFCFDPKSGPFYSGSSSSIAMAIGPAADLSHRIVDRVGVIILTGNQAEISFD